MAANELRPDDMVLEKDPTQWGVTEKFRQVQKILILSMNKPLILYLTFWPVKSINSYFVTSINGRLKIFDISRDENRFRTISKSLTFWKMKIVLERFQNFRYLKRWTSFENDLKIFDISSDENRLRTISRRSRILCRHSPQRSAEDTGHKQTWQSRHKRHGVHHQQRKQLQRQNSWKI